MAPYRIGHTPVFAESRFAMENSTMKKDRNKNNKHPRGKKNKRRKITRRRQIERKDVGCHSTCNHHISNTPP